MAHIRMQGDNYEARCEHCGAWQTIEPRQTGADGFFVHWQADFTCCGIKQNASFTEEKDEIDVH